MVRWETGEDNVESATVRRVCRKWSSSGCSCATNAQDIECEEDEVYIYHDDGVDWT